jgi:hypothetical protein
MISSPSCYIFLLFLLLLLLETGSCYVAQASLVFSILLPQLPSAGITALRTSTSGSYSCLLLMK